MFANLCRLLREKLALPDGKWHPNLDTTLKEPRATVLIPGARVRYLAEIAEQGRAINNKIESQAETADRAQSYWQSLHDLGDDKLPKALDLYAAEDLVGATSVATPSASGDVATDVAPTRAVDRTLVTLRQRY